MSCHCKQSTQTGQACVYTSGHKRASDSAHLLVIQGSSLPAGKTRQRRRTSHSAVESPANSRPSTATPSRPNTAALAANASEHAAATQQQQQQQPPAHAQPARPQAVPPRTLQQLSASPFVRDASLQSHMSTCDLTAERQSSQGADALERQTTDATQQDLSLLDRLDESWMGGGSSFMSSSGNIVGRRRPPLPPAAPTPDVRAHAWPACSPLQSTCSCY